jgi:DNA-directed RNA polymerase subunit M/transcription elongation factor TFIIS
MTDSSIPEVRRSRDPNERGDTHFPCENCGARLTFTPGSTVVTCTHCGHEQAIANEADAATANVEHDYQDMLRNLTRGAAMEETKVKVCPSCGAQTDFPEGVQAAACPFCDTPFVTDTGTHRHIKPAGVLPFQLDERTARGEMVKWMGSLWFAPNGLTEYARAGRAMTGIYVPYWTFDADTKTAYTGQRGDAYYETRTVTRNGRTETERVRKIRWSYAKGRVARFFDDVLVLASKSLPKSHTDALEPWDLSALQSYQPQYLSGFAAEGYQVELPDGFAEAQQIMDAQIRRDIRQDIGGDEQRINTVDTDIRDVTFKHVLLPVWMAAYKYRDRTFRFVVNGQTGKVQGERPWSGWKIAFAVIAALILLAAVGYGFYLADQAQ